MNPSQEIVVIDRTNKSVDYFSNESEAYEFANDLVGHGRCRVLVCKIILEVNKP